MRKKSGSGMIIPDNLETQFFGLKMLKFFDADPGSGILSTLDPEWKIPDPGYKKKHSGSATLM
jgi:hypothetical protein